MTGIIGVDYNITYRNRLLCFRVEHACPNPIPIALQVIIGSIKEKSNPYWNTARCIIFIVTCLLGNFGLFFRRRFEKEIDGKRRGMGSFTDHDIKEYWQVSRSEE